jgi:hypothetical protein
MQLRDNIGDRVAHSGDFSQASLRNQLLKRLRQRHQIFRCPRVSTRSVRIPAPKCRALAEFVEQFRNFRCSKGRHWVNQGRSDCLLTPESGVGAAGAPT